jgi:plasmid rolling circle replication initiator protein Rep
MALGNGVNSFRSLTTCINKKREALRILEILWRWAPCNKIITNTKTKKTIRNTTISKGYRPKDPPEAKEVVQLDVNNGGIP